MAGGIGGMVGVRPPFYCEYGAISIGARTLVNGDQDHVEVPPR